MKNFKKFGKDTVITLACVGVVCGSFYIGNVSAKKGIVVGNVPKDAVQHLEQVSDTEKYSELFTLRNMLFSKYDGELDDNKLLEGALKGMAGAVGDPYTVYMNSNELQTFLESSQGSFYGIGAQLGIREGKVTIIAPVEGSASEKAGLKAGDIILKVDDFVVEEANTDSVVSRVRGEEGKAVKLLIQRGIQEPFEVSIVREEIKTESVKGELLEDNIGYIQLTTFSDEQVSTKFREVLDKLKSLGMEKLVLDLRGNPGGYLEECVKIVSNFIKSGEIVTYTIDKYDKKIESKSKGGDYLGLPLVVLVDGGSASASEVVTGALRDHKAATIIGTKTFGKGIVQQLLQVPGEDSGLKVTTSRYYTPNGENIHETGIKPDIEVVIPEEVLKKEYSRELDTQFKKALEVIKEK